MKTVILFFFSFYIFHAVSAQSNDLIKTKELEKIKGNARQLVLSDVAYATEQSYQLTDDITYNTDGKGYFKSMTPAGSWGDIDYSSQTLSTWKPSWHLYRTMLICREYYKTQNPQYLAAVHKSMAFWIKNDFICKNWWHNNINVPFTYTSLMLMLGKDALKEESDFLNNVIIKRIPLKNGTGQNLIWQLDNEARVALIKEDMNEFSKIMLRMQEVISITVKEGIQPDYSFHQHGSMLQFGNYGMHFTNSLLFWITVTSNTSVAFDAQKQQIFFDYLSKGLRWSVYNKAMDITAVGRQIRLNSGIKRGENLAVNSIMIRSFDKGKACDYFIDGFKDAEQLQCKIEGNKSFWRSDYMIDRNDKYMMSVKTNGPFVSPVETIIRDNLKGAYLNDGVTLIQQSGQEYRNIEPLWNWAMLPGITADTTANPTIRPAPSQGDFTGQVSNGQDGVSVMDYNRNGIKAHKSYFFSGASMVALGADIKAPDMKNIVTVVDQKFYSTKHPLRSSKDLDKNRWLWMDSVAYIFPDSSTRIKTKIENKKASWYDIDNNSSSKKLVSGNLFTAYVQHDKQDKYVYVVKPGITLDETKKIQINKELKVIANTGEIQAIEFNKKVMAVFYTAGSINLSNKSVIKVDQSCMLIFEKKNGRNLLWLSDPTRKLKNVTLSIDGITKIIDFPFDNYLGSTIQIAL